MFSLIGCWSAVKGFVFIFQLLNMWPLPQKVTTTTIKMCRFSLSQDNGIQLNFSSFYTYSLKRKKPAFKVVSFQNNANVFYVSVCWTLKWRLTLNTQKLVPKWLTWTTHCTSPDSCAEVFLVVLEHGCRSWSLIRAGSQSLFHFISLCLGPS